MHVHSFIHSHTLIPSFHKCVLSTSFGPGSRYGTEVLKSLPQVAHRHNKVITHNVISSPVKVWTRTGQAQKGERERERYFIRDRSQASQKRVDARTGF